MKVNAPFVSKRLSRAEGKGLMASYRAREKVVIMPQPSLSATLTAAMEPIFQRILVHPFVTGLSDGSLPLETFASYVVQDAHYLRGYARALAIVAAKAPDAATTALFAEHARVAIEVESELHADFMVALSELVADRALVGPTTVAYTSYLLATCHQGGFAEALAAVLPCYWIYAKVAESLLQASSPEPLYRRWIETYSGEEFGRTLDTVLAAVDAVGAWAGEGQVAAMRDHVVMTARYEWMFWDAGWRRENCPV
jgi:thiaminase/transcriptional activator TenA